MVSSLISYFTSFRWLGSCMRWTVLTDGASADHDLRWQLLPSLSRLFVFLELWYPLSLTVDTMLRQWTGVWHNKMGYRFKMLICLEKKRYQFSWCQINIFLHLYINKPVLYGVEVLPYSGGGGGGEGVAVKPFCSKSVICNQKTTVFRLRYEVRVVFLFFNYLNHYDISLFKYDTITNFIMSWQQKT